MREGLKFLKKHDDVFLAIYLFCIIAGNALNVLISNSDELWNFFNIFKISNGFLIYKDLNIIMTPLFFYLGKIFLRKVSHLASFIK